MAKSIGWATLVTCRPGKRNHPLHIFSWIILNCHISLQTALGCCKGQKEVHPYDFCHYVWKKNHANSSDVSYLAWTWCGYALAKKILWCSWMNAFWSAILDPRAGVCAAAIPPDTLAQSKSCALPSPMCMVPGLL